MTQTDILTDNPTIISKIKEKHRNKLVSQFLFERARNTLKLVGLRLNLSIVFAENTADLTRPETDLQDYEVCHLSEKDMPEIVAMGGYFYPTEELVSRLRDRSICVGLKHNGKIVSYTWCDVIDPQDRVFAVNYDVFFYDAYTSKAYRGKNLIMLVRYHAYKELEKMGLLNFISTSDYFNTSAIKFKKKLNARPVQLVFYVNLFSKFKKNFVLKNL